MRTTASQLHDKTTPITVVTAYDACLASIVDDIVDAILVGDSLGMVVQGHDTTLPVTVDDIIYHTRAVVRGTKQAHIVADMPFMSYNDVPLALHNAGRLIKEGGAQSVKLEGGEGIAPIVGALVKAGIPVMGHLGLRPQSVNVVGGYRIQGRDEETALQISRDAFALQLAGAFAVVLECVPRGLAKTIRQQLSIPTIGIGAGPDCGGQVLVGHDMLGLTQRTPRFVRRFAELREDAAEATQMFVESVRDGKFPDDDTSYD